MIKDNLHHLKVFCSYAHADGEYLKQLLEHIKVLQHVGILDPWTDGSIRAGDEWASKISDNLEQSDIILFLVSSSFIASEYCYKIEMERALELHKDGQAAVIPIIVRPCFWNVTPFSKLEALPTDAKPITTWNNIDEAWTDVTRGINEKVEALSNDRVPELIHTEIEKIQIKTRSITPVPSPEEQKKQLVLGFLKLWKRYWFNAARIANWGGQQKGFDLFKKLGSTQIKKVLNSLVSEGSVIRNPKKPHMYKAK